MYWLVRSFVLLLPVIVVFQGRKLRSYFQTSILCGRLRKTSNASSFSEKKKFKVQLKFPHVLRRLSSPLKQSGLRKTFMGGFQNFFQENPFLKRVAFYLRTVPTISRGATKDKVKWQTNKDKMVTSRKEAIWRDQK